MNITAQPIGLLIAPSLTHIAVAGGLFYGTQRFFAALEERLTAEAKLKVWWWIGTTHPTESVKLMMSSFITLFDRLYGNRHFTFSCFGRSLLTSLIVAVVGTCVLWSIFPEARVFPAFGTVAAVFLSSIVPDYISLLETRFALKRMARSDNGYHVGLLLLLDLCATAVLSASGPAIAPLVYIGILEGKWTTVENAWPFIREQTSSIVLHAGGNLTGFGQGIYFSGFAYSLWLWLFVLSGMALKIVRSYEFGVGWMYRHLDVETKPLQSIGLISGTLLAVAYLAVTLIA